jgi:hypothetical protein
MNRGGDVITLTVPADEGFDRIVHLVVGGLAVRLDVTFEHLEDLHLALDGLLEERIDARHVTVSVRVLDDEIATTVGPFVPGRLQAQLDLEPRGGLGLRRVLETVVDGFDLSEREEGEWIELRKTVHRARRDG